VGGLIGHCVSPQPWREIDAHAPDLHSLTPVCTKSFVGWGFAPDPIEGAYSWV